MDELASDLAGPGDEIARLEEHIEGLAIKLEGCRKLSLAARLAMVLGGVILLALLLGAIPFDPLAMSASIVALLGGIVLSGSNRSTANEIEAELAEAEASRAALIGRIELRVVSGTKTLH